MTNQITWTASNGSIVTVTATDVLTMAVNGVVVTKSDNAGVVVTNPDLIAKGAYASFGDKYISKELYDLCLTLNTIVKLDEASDYDKKYEEIEKAMSY
jgi:hypothetical protein